MSKGFDGISVIPMRDRKKTSTLRFTLLYINNGGRERWEDSWHPRQESIDFKTQKEALQYAELLTDEERPRLRDNVTGKITDLTKETVL